MPWGISEVDVTSSEPNGLMSELVSNNIKLLNIIAMDSLSLRFCVKRRDLPAVKQIVRQRFDELVEIKDIGLLTILNKSFARPVLIVSIIVWLLLLLYLPGRILFVQVEGNHRVPTQMIIEYAGKCGIAFGAARGEVRSEKIKTALLAEIPELQWIGVNTYGCLAVISVSERSLTESASTPSTIGHIISMEDGIINSLTVTKGTPLCSPGQAVVKGQILVSGYTDCGLTLKAGAASAEVVAITKRSVTAKIPNNKIVRKQIIGTQTDYSIQIGKNVVELTSKTGIPEGRCVKIYEIDSLVLPGGFQLPVKLVREKTVSYSLEKTNDIMPENEIRFLAEKYIKKQMLMGRILSENYFNVATGDCYEMNALYICEEMIGKFRKEEILK